MKYHPDRNRWWGSTGKFKEASEAFEVLSDQGKRQKYDQFGHSAEAWVMDSAVSVKVQGLEIFSAISSAILGRWRPKGQRGERGSDLQYNLEIKFEDAAFGTSRELDIPRMETCNTCGGFGCAFKSDIETCNNCGGTGQQRIQQGFFSVTTTCAACSGGQTIPNVCHCRRTRVKKTRKSG